MKSMLALASAALMVGSMALAADKAEDKASESTSKNPITGTTTTTKEETSTGKDAAGNSHEVKAKSVTKHKKNGKVEKEVKVKADTKSAE